MRRKKKKGKRGARGRPNDEMAKGEREMGQTGVNKAEIRQNSAWADQQATSYKAAARVHIGNRWPARWSGEPCSNEIDCRARAETTDVNRPASGLRSY
jgi:hypothetical protein